MDSPSALAYLGHGQLLVIVITVQWVEERMRSEGVKTVSQVNFLEEHCYER